MSTSGWVDNVGMDSKFDEVLKHDGYIILNFRPTLKFYTESEFNRLWCTGFPDRDKLNVHIGFELQNVLGVRSSFSGNIYAERIQSDKFIVNRQEVSMKKNISKKFTQIIPSIQHLPNQTIHIHWRAFYPYIIIAFSSHTNHFKFSL